MGDGGRPKYSTERVFSANGDRATRQRTRGAEFVGRSSPSRNSHVLPHSLCGTVRRYRQVDGHHAGIRHMVTWTATSAPIPTLHSVSNEPRVVSDRLRLNTPHNLYARPRGVADPSASNRRAATHRG